MNDFIEISELNFDDDFKSGSNSNSNSNSNSGGGLELLMNDRVKNGSSKMRGGYREVNHATWSTVEFDETEKRNIQNYLKEHPGSLSTTIRENLFPNMSENLKRNANYEIQVVLGRQVGMR